jgi:hypothetical protein
MGLLTAAGNGPTYRDPTRLRRFGSGPESARHRRDSDCDRLIAQIRNGRRDVVVNPPAEGLPIDEGWSTLHRLVDEVLPHS